VSKIIIGIHGLGNKPPEKVLKHWWKKAIREGVRTIGHPRLYFNFKMVYWAHHLHPRLLDPQEKNRKSPLFIEEPYVPAIDHSLYRPEKFRQKVLDYMEKQLDRVLLNDDLSLNFSSITDLILRRYFKDLNDYYTNEILDEQTSPPVKTLIQEELAKVLRKHRKKAIMLIAHSMGSIIAYDVLTQITPEVNVDTFVTVGSPLGLPVIMSRIAMEQARISSGNKKITSPENVRRNWYNFSDLHDRVTINYNLGDDYESNSRGVQAVDYIVHNNYEQKGKKNPHKAYGYLRTPELGNIIHQFLNYGKPEEWIWITDKIDRLLSLQFKKPS
jgi:hypothetical protein